MIKFRYYCYNEGWKLHRYEVVGWSGCRYVISEGYTVRGDTWLMELGDAHRSGYVR